MPQFDFNTKLNKSIKSFPVQGFSTIFNLPKKEYFILNLFAVVVGVVAGYGSIIFMGLIAFVQNLAFFHRLDFHLISPLGHDLNLWVIGLPAIGLICSAYLVEKFAVEAKGHGIPEVIEAVVRKGGILRPRVIFIKALASSLTIGFGGSVGREGPIVQIGATFGSFVSQVFKQNPGITKTLLGCGAAGAIAATFNTPIGGVIFAIEIIILELKAKSFIPLVISSVFATLVSRIYLGNDPAFDLYGFSYELVSNHELFLYLGLAIICGIMGTVFIKTLYKIEDTFEEAKIPFILKPIIAGLTVGGIGYFRPEIFGAGYDAISAVLTNSSSFHIMLSLIFLKIIATSLTIAGGGSGGVFAPSLYIGAMTGGAYGYLMNQFFPDWTAHYGAYGLVGMAALFAASTRATFTSIVILFEMTLDYELILPLMFVCVIADQVAVLLSRGTIYSIKLKRKGINFKSEMSVNVLAVTKARDIMTQKIVAAKEDMTLKECTKKLLGENHPIYPILGAHRELIGYITNVDIHRVLHERGGSVKVAELKKKALHIVSPDETVLDILKKADAGTEGSHFFVVERNKLIGIVSGRDIARIASID